MTNEEAIRWLDMIKKYYIHGGDEAYDKKRMKAIDKAIQALDAQPCGDCISREEAIRIAEQGQIQGYEWQFKKLCNLPSITLKQKIGKWIDGFGGCNCSECGCLEAGYSNYCPNCGAKMEVNADEDSN